MRRVLCVSLLCQRTYFVSHKNAKVLFETDTKDPKNTLELLFNHSFSVNWFFVDNHIHSRYLETNN